MDYAWNAGVSLVQDHRVQGEKRKTNIMKAGKWLAVVTCLASFFLSVAVSSAEDVSGLLSEGLIKKIDESTLVIYHIPNADPEMEKEFSIGATTILCVDDKVVNGLDAFKEDSHIGILVDQNNSGNTLYLLSGKYELSMAGMMDGFVSMDALPLKSHCE